VSGPNSEPPPAAGDARAARPSWLAPALLVTFILIAAVVFVASSLRRPELAMFEPTASAPEPVTGLVGPRTYTIDSSDDAAWQYFDFSRGARVEPTDPLDWDIAFRRFHVIANGGTRFAGTAGVIDLGPVAFDSVTEAPADGYLATEAARDSVNRAIDRWYIYSWISHILKSSDHVYVVRTADGRYAKMRIVSYYCMGAMPGCMTFEYVYQESGDRSFGRQPAPIDSLLAR
jgi:HmuY protein